MSRNVCYFGSQYRVNISLLLRQYAGWSVTWWKFSCHNSFTSISRHYHVIITSLSRHYHDIIMTLSWNYHDIKHYHAIITTLSRHYHTIITTLSHHYHDIITTLSRHFLDKVKWMWRATGSTGVVLARYWLELILRFTIAIILYISFNQNK